MPRLHKLTPSIGYFSAAAVLALGSSCFAQGKPGPAAQGAVALADEPFRLHSVGLVMRVPAGTTAETTAAIGAQKNVVIIPDDKAWSINIQTPMTTNEKTTIAAVLQQTIDHIKTSYGVVDPSQQFYYDKDTRAKILEQTDKLELPGGTAARLYVSVPKTNNTRVVNGYTIFKPGPKQFVVFEFECAEALFSSFRAVYETTIGTASFVNNEELMMARGAAVKAGTAFVQQLSEHDYQTAFGTDEQWYRLYVPSKSGAAMDAQELGYRGVKFWRGKRGEVNPGKAKSQWTRADQQEGYLCQVRGRIIVEGGIGDTMGMYFMTPDRAEEMWSVTTAFKDPAGKLLAQASETGARLKNDITVLKEESGKPQTHVKPPIMGEGYISQLETFLIARLMVQKNMRTDLGFYAYQSTPNNSISFRRESAKKEGSMWTVTTTVREDMPPQVSIYLPTGDLQSTHLDDGRIWEPIQLQQLKKLWESKGMPVNK